MKRYAIAYNDSDGTYYWTTRAIDTDNYTAEKKDATLFATRDAAFCLMKCLGLDADEHKIVALIVA